MKNAKDIELLNSLRNKIDVVDRQIIGLLNARMLLIEEIGKIKVEMQISAEQNERWNKISVTRKEWAKQFNLSETLINDIFNIIHKESLDRQNKING